MLTDQEIDALFDEHGWSPSTMYYPVVSAIEQVATAPLLARIAELEAELEKTKAVFAASCNHAAVMEMDRDARRYRWLRERMIGVDFDWAENGITALAFEMPDGCSFGVSCDQNIDAAMKEQGYA